MYVEFTHSQSFETFARCHLHAFHALGGVAREVAYDNLATAVAEHDGRLVRFTPRFLGFARDYGFYPRACNPASGWELPRLQFAGAAYPMLPDISDTVDIHKGQNGRKRPPNQQADQAFLLLLKDTLVAAVVGFTNVP